MAKEFLPFAPWHQPRFRRIAPGVEVATAYGSHVLAAVVHGLWRKLLHGDSFWKVADAD